MIVTGLPRPDPEQVATLARYGVATVHEAMGRTGSLGPGLRPIQQGVRTGGSAVTVLCPPGDNLMIHAAVEQCADGDLLVVALTSPCTDGLFGELFATALARRGVRGVVIDAGVRDTAELRAMGFPAWSAAVCARGSVKASAGAVNVPVVIGGQVIAPGDAVLADDDGVMCVPRHLVATALRASEARARKEEASRAAYAAGELSLDRSGLRDTLDRLGVRYAAADGVRCMVMRGGTSKGAYFLAEDLPAVPAERDDLLMRIMGSGDQTDGLGGGHPLTSKVAVVSRSADGDADVDYLFLQVGDTVSGAQTCGNLLAGVPGFARERGLVPEGTIRIRMVNTGDVATVTASAEVRIELPQRDNGFTRHQVAGVEVTCVDSGMPVVLIHAADLGVTGYESPAELEADGGLAVRLARIRHVAAELMGLGDVSASTVPKLTLLSPPRHGGDISTRTFIPVRCHTAIGVLGALSVAAGLEATGRFRIEHPSGFLDVEDGTVIRTARKIFDGTVYPRR